MMRWIATDALWVTHGELRSGRVTSRSVRALALASHGDAASLVFTFHGFVGDVTGQVGVDLRTSGTSIVSVIWPLMANAHLAVRVRAPEVTYLWINPVHSERIAMPVVGKSYKLSARIDGDRLSAWVGEQLVWFGWLPLAVRALRGLVGLRTDHVSADIALAAD